MPENTKPEQMPWHEVRRILREEKPKSRALEEKADEAEQNLRAYYGEERFSELRELAKSGAQIRAALGNVVLLPGIMGSHLSVRENGGDTDAVWFNLLRIIKGDLQRLRLQPDGKTNVNGETVEATGLIGWYYARALEYLQAEPFPYDWRLNISDTADRLADFVRNAFAAGERINFVAHSMGGLVVREFVRKHNALWNEIEGRLIMLGTPNSGSFAAVETLMGKNDTAKKLSKVDLRHNAAEIFRIINTFLGMYQLCPSKLINPEVYDGTLWQAFPDVLFNDYLLKIPDFHQNLFNERAATIDAKRMTYIAGVGYDTPFGLETGGSGGALTFTTTLEGDGTVSHRLGLLEGVKTFYVEEAHADLPNNWLVLNSVRDILRTGDTALLTTTKPATKRARSMRSQAEDDLDSAETVARALETGKEPDASIVFEAEKKVLRSILGGNLDYEAEPTSFFDEEEPRSRTACHKLKVEVLAGNIIGADAPVLAVGQYQNIPPSGSIGDLDTALDYGITVAYMNGVIGTALGQLFIVPLKGKKLDKKVEVLIVGGMGEHVRFNRDNLRYLMMNIALATMTLGYDRFATVLIGTSFKTISVDRGVRSILAGVADALERRPNGKPLPPLTLVLVENKLPRVEMIKNSIEEIIRKQEEENAPVVPGLEIELVEKPKTNISKTVVERAKKRARQNESDFVREFAKRRKEDEKELTRITIERTPGLIRLSALTATAAIPLREIQVQDFIIDSAIEKLRAARTFREQDKYGRLLHTILIPEEFQSLIDSNRSLVLLLNRNAAAIPWEMVGYGSARGMSNFGINLNVTRQFSSLAAAMPGVSPPLNDTFRALVIANPARERDLQLAGAQIEGEEIRKLFIRLKAELKGKVDFQFETRIGHEQCDIVEILSLIAEKEFDLVHFAGHGTFDPRDAKKSGWVFGRDEKTGELKILTALEIFRLRHVPRLVFANACFSSQLGTEAEIPSLSTAETSRILAGLAEAFFNRGIENYIGAGWQVDDIYATDFAKLFYLEALSKGRNIGEALSEARTSISAQALPRVQINSTWGAYQHYGDSNTPLVR